MTILAFPPNPTVGELYAFATKQWEWNGSGWALVPPAFSGVDSLNGLVGDVTLEAGDNITLTLQSGNVIQISATGGVSELLVDNTAGGSIIFDDSGDVLYEG